jgi:hypothetical protein
MAWTWCIQTLGNVPIAHQATHLRELRDGYGDVEPEMLIAAMVRQQTRIVDAEQANLHDMSSRDSCCACQGPASSAIGLPRRFRGKQTRRDKVVRAHPDFTTKIVPHGRSHDHIGPSRVPSAIAHQLVRARREISRRF